MRGLRDLPRQVDLAALDARDRAAFGRLQTVGKLQGGVAVEAAAAFDHLAGLVGIRIGEPGEIAQINPVSRMALAVEALVQHRSGIFFAEVAWALGAPLGVRFTRRVGGQDG